jgi:hypothetical protein
MTHTELVEIFSDPDHITTQAEIDDLFYNYIEQHRVMIKLDGIVHMMVKEKEKTLDKTKASL